jgi:GrpB-like predicted nucleotidyltransferase (UPF0157 family)
MLEKYSRNWANKFEEEAEKLKKIFNNDIKDIQHIGSTSIPEITAKPIIDITILVESIDIHNIEKYSGLVEKLGYKYKPELSSNERIFYRKGQPVEYHLSISSPKYSFWNRQLDFRDFLISRPDLIKEYSKIKEESIKGLSQEELDDLSLSELYNSRKGPFIEKVLEMINTKVNL